MKPAQSNLSLPEESFALVGQVDHAPRCQDCGRVAFLVSGFCEPCTNERAQAFIISEALQRTFFGETT